MNIDDIAREIKILIDSEVIKKNNDIWRDRYVELVDEIRNVVAATKNKIEYCNDNKLSASSIMAEGYLSCALRLQTFAEDWDEDI